MTTDLVPTAGAFKGNPTGLELVRQPSFEEWDALGCWLRAANTSLPWLVGDWANLGSSIFGEQASQGFDVEEATGWTPTTIGVYAWVCKSIPPERRRADLSFAHHQVLAALDGPEQTKWLEAAATDPDGVWSTRELKRAIKTAGDGKPAEVWVVVSAKDAADAEWLVGQMVSQGRTAKVAG